MSPTLEILQKLFERDLSLLAKEIKAYPDEASLWKASEGINNPGGNLCLHLCGNLQYFIGVILGKTSYIRNREAEFADKDIPKEKLLEEIEATQKTIARTLRQMDPAALDQVYPIEVFGEPMSTQYFLVHLATHLTYHRGQINYHRRMI